MKEHGYITTMDAFQLYGDTRLSDTIFRLRKAGYIIASDYTKGKNRYGDDTHYVEYRLIEEGDPDKCIE